MKTNLLNQLIVIALTIASSFYSQKITAQSIKIIPLPNGITWVSQTPIIYNNALIFNSYGTSGSELAKYDGINITPIPGPDSNYAQSLFLPLIFNNKLCFSYKTKSFLDQLGQYDGTNVTYIASPYSYFGYGVIFNNNIFFGFFVKFDGTNITPFPGLSGADSINFSPYGRFLIYNNNLYTTFSNYPNPSAAIQLGQYNTTGFTLIPNPTVTSGVIGGVFLNNGYITYNNKLFFPYSNPLPWTVSGAVQLAQYDGNSISLIPSPNSSEYSTLSSPIVYNNKLYMQYKNASGVYQVAQYDGTAVTLIPNPDASIDSTDFAFIIYGNKLYFKYKNVSGIYQLAQYDGNTITLIPNPDAGLGYGDLYDNFYVGGVYPIVANNMLYINYRAVAGGNYLAQYDGTNLTLIPDAGPGYDGYPIVYNNTLYFYYIDSGYDHLAYLDTRTLPITLLNLKGQLQDNNVFLQSQTAIEQNGNHFTIQRSKDGTTFSNIGQVKAVGNSNSIKNYNYTDLAVVKLDASKLFYRLEEVDNDGKKQFSNIVSIDITNRNDQINIYPNPANNIIHLDLPYQLSPNSLIVLYDINGRKVIQQKPQLNNLHQQLNLNKLQSGKYSLEIIDSGKKVFTKQVVIVH